MDEEPSKNSLGGKECEVILSGLKEQLILRIDWAGARRTRISKKVAKRDTYYSHRRSDELSKEVSHPIKNVPVANGRGRVLEASADGSVDIRLSRA